MDPCRAPGINTCQRCNAVKGCVFCPSSGECVSSRSIEWDKSIVSKCVIDDAIFRAGLCPTEEIDERKAPATDPIRTTGGGEDDPSRFRLKFDPVDPDTKCIEVVAIDGDLCLEVRKGSATGATDFDAKACTTTTVRTARLCVTRGGLTVSGRRLLAGSDYDASVSGSGTGDMYVVPQGGSTTAAGTTTAASGTTDTAASSTSAAGTTSAASTTSAATGAATTGAATTGTAATGTAKSGASAVAASFLLVAAAIVVLAF